MFKKLNFQQILINRYKLFCTQKNILFYKKFQNKNKVQENQSSFYENTISVLDLDICRKKLFFYRYQSRETFTINNEIRRWQYIKYKYRLYFYFFEEITPIEIKKSNH